MGPDTQDTAQPSLPAQRAFASKFSAASLARQFRTGIRISQLSTLAGQTGINTLVTLFLAGLISLFVYVEGQHSLIVVWFLAQVAFSVLVYWRVRQRRAVVSDSFDDSRRTRKGLIHAVVWAALSGGLWGALTLFLPDASPDLRVAIILAIAGIAAGATTTLASVPQVAIAYICACGIPLFIYFVLSKTALDLLLAIYTVVFVSAMIGATRVIYLTLERRLDAEERTEYYRAANLRQQITAAAKELRPVEDFLHDCLEKLCVYAGWPAGRVHLKKPQEADEWTSTDFWFKAHPHRLRSSDLLGATKFCAGSGLLLSSVVSTAQPQSQHTHVRPAARLNADENDAARSGSGSVRSKNIALTVIGVPVLVGPTVTAVLEFVTTQPDRPTQDRIALLAAIGIQMGGVIERHGVVRQLKESQNRIRREEDRAREYLDIAGSLILAIDREGCVTLLNKAGAKLLACTESQAIGENCFDRFMPAKTREIARAIFEDWIRGKEALVPEQEMLLLSTDGEIHFVRAQVALLTDDDGDVYGMLASGQDVTQQRRVEGHLRQAQKMEAVGQLASGIAHDFNNILTVAGGNLELLHESHAFDAEASRYLKRSQSALASAAALTSQLLSFSRRSVLLPKPVDVGAVLENMMAFVGRTLGATIEIAIVKSPGLWFAFADAIQLESSLLNLAINSRDAMPDGGRLEMALGNVHIDHSAAAGIDVTPGDYVSIAVSDAGCGMSSEIQRRVFEPFFTTKTGQGGTGLGLSMVYGFAKQSNGTVSVDSTLGAGSVVTLLLPRSTKAPQSQGKLVGVDGNPDAQSKNRILVVDDDILILDLACTVLERAGFNVSRASSAIEALDYLQGTLHIDLLLTDIRLGSGPDGYQLAKQMVDEWSSMQVIFMSGYADAKSVVNDWPDSVWLHKPFELREMVRIVADLLQVRGG